MLSLIIAGILSLPGLLVLVLSIPVVVVLSIPALAVLLFRKPAAAKQTCAADLETRRVVVTGGSSGIGKAIACESAKRGVSEVVIIARNEERLEEAKKEIQAISSQTTVKALSVDVSDANALAKAAKLVFGKEDPPKRTHVFCCAGEPHPDYFQNVPCEVYARIVNTNQLGSIYTAKAFLDHMKTGSITFCSSIAGQLGVFGYSSYCPTKFALRGFAECLHIELCNSPIHIQVAYPPDTDTPGFEKENEIKPEETRFISENAGLAKPDHIAQTMVHQAIKENPPFNVYFSFDGFMTTTLTAGFSPVSTLLDAVAQVAAMSLIRWVSLFYLQDWYRLIRDYQAKAKDKPKAQQVEPKAELVRNETDGETQAEDETS